MVRFLIHRPKWIVAVVGYTDNVGPAEDNKRLAEERVQTVKKAMIAGRLRGVLFSDSFSIEGFQIQFLRTSHVLMTCVNPT